MMFNPVIVALATITVMLWLVWTDTVRTHKPTPILYGLRVLLFLAVSGVLVMNMLRYPRMYPGSVKGLTIVAVLVGIGGAVYFARRIMRRSQGV